MLAFSFGSSSTFAVMYSWNLVSCAQNPESPTKDGFADFPGSLFRLCM